MEDLRKLLIQVREGRTSFTPDGPSKEEMIAFQPIAKALIHAKQMGYLEDCHARKESRTGQGYYALVMLRGGLSYLGEKFLEQSPAGENNAGSLQQPQSTEDVIDLKPNFFGLGVNLNALWRKLRRGKT